MVDSHKVWLIAGISIAIIVFAGLFLYPQIDDGFAGEAVARAGDSSTPISRTQLSFLTTKVGLSGCGTNEGDDACLNRITAKVSEVVQERDNSLAQIETLNSQLTTKENLLSTSNAQLSTKTQALATKSQQLVQSQTTLNARIKDLNLATAQINTLKQTETKLSNDLNSLQASHETLKKDYSVKDTLYKAVLADSTQAVVGLESSVNALTSERNSLLNDKNSLNAQLKSLSDAKAIATTQLGTIKTERDQLASSVEDLNKQLIARNSEVYQKAEAIASLTNQISTKEQEIATQSNLRTNAENALQTRTIERDNFKTALDSLSTEHSVLLGQASNFQKQVSDLSNQLASAQQGASTELLNLQSLSQERAGKITTLETKLGRLTADLDQLEGARSQLVSQIAEKEGLISAKDSKLAELNTRLSGEVTRANAALASVEQIKSELSVSQKSRDELGARVTTLDKNLKDRDSTISELTTQKDTYLSQVQNLDTQRAVLEASVSTWKTKHTDLNNQYLALQGDTSSAYRGLQQSLAEKESIVSSLETTRAALTTERDQLVNSVTKLETDLARTIGEVEGLRINVAETLEERNAFSSQVSILKGERLALQAAAESARKQLEETNVAYGTLNANFESLSTSSDKTKSQLTSVNEHLLTVTQDKTQLVTGITNVLASSDIVSGNSVPELLAGLNQFSQQTVIVDPSTGDLNNDGSVTFKDAIDLAKDCFGTYDLPGVICMS